MRGTSFRSVKFVLFNAVIVAITCALLSSAALAQTNKKIKIGVIAPLTGEYASLGASLVNCAKMAQLDWNKANPNLQAELIIEDDGFSAPKGVAAAKKLIDIDRVDALLNSSTPTINAIYPTVKASGLPTMQLGIMEEEVADNVFMLQPDPEKFAFDFGVDYSTKGYQNSIVFYFEDPSVVTLVDAFRKGLKSKLTEMPIGQGDVSSIKSLVTKALATKPDNLVFALSIAQNGLILKELIAQSGEAPLPNMFFLFDLEIGLEQVYEMLGDLTPILDAQTATNRKPVDRSFLTRYEELYQAPMQPWSEYGYDSIKILMESFHKDARLWVENIAGYNNNGVTGPIKFDRRDIREPTYRRITTIREIVERE